MITGAPDLDEAVSLTRNGLFEYITKPVSFAGLAAAIKILGEYWFEIVELPPGMPGE